MKKIGGGWKKSWVTFAASLPPLVFLVFFISTQARITQYAF